MPLPTFNSKEDIPEVMRDGYVERNGKWVPEIDDSGMRDNQRRAVEEARVAKDALRSLLGDRKPEEVADILRTHQSAEEERAKKAGDFDKLLEKRVNETKAEYEKRIAELAPYKTKYEDRELDIAIRDAASKSGVNSDDMR